MRRPHRRRSVTAYAATREQRMISGVSKVVVPVDDQKRAKEFWTTRMGFELRRDESYGDHNTFRRAAA
jgi:hypothetical protein